MRRKKIGKSKELKSSEKPNQTTVQTDQILLSEAIYEVGKIRGKYSAHVYEDLSKKVTLLHVNNTQRVLQTILEKS